MPKITVDEEVQASLDELKKLTGYNDNNALLLDVLKVYEVAATCSSLGQEIIIRNRYGQELPPLRTKILNKLYDEYTKTHPIEEDGIPSTAIKHVKMRDESLVEVDFTKGKSREV